MMMYLTPFVDLFNEKLSKIGVDCFIRGRPQNLKIYCINCTVDSIYRPMIQGIRQFKGFCGCNWCTIPGVMLDTNRYSLIQCQNYKARDHESMIQQMRNLFEGQETHVDEGVISVCPLINLLHFDIVESFGNDYLHAALLGVAPHITELILRTLKPKNIDLIDTYLTNIKIPYQLCRVTRSIKERNLWKGKEWESWILFYSLPIFGEIATPELVEYWSSFVQSLYICLSVEISHDDLRKVNEMLLEFRFKTEVFFGIFEMTFTLHLVVEHLAKQVVNWGPLWATSCFPFESANRSLLRAIKSPVGVNQQIIRYLNLCHTVLELEKKVLPSASEFLLKIITKFRHIQLVKVSVLKITSILVLQR